MKSLRIKKKLGTGLAAGLAVFALAACTGNESERRQGRPGRRDVAGRSGLQRRRG